MGLVTVACSRSHLLRMKSSRETTRKNEGGGLRRGKEGPPYLSSQMSFQEPQENEEINYET